VRCTIRFKACFRVEKTTKNSDLGPSRRARSAFSENHLGLGHHGYQFAVLSLEAGLPYLGTAPAMNGGCGCDQSSSLPCTADEVGLALDRGGAPCVFRQVDEGGRRPHRIRKRHQRSAMSCMVERTQVGPNQHARHHPIPFGFSERDALQFGERHGHRADFLKWRHVGFLARCYLKAGQVPIWYFPVRCDRDKPAIFRHIVRMRQFPPRRIICLTEETVETLYLLGEQDRIAGVSGYAVRPPQVRREKPRVSAFISADIPKILKLEPDLVLAFSDLQGDIVADLVRAGVNVHAFNQRDVAGILSMIRTLGALTGASGRAEELAAGYERRLAAIASAVRPSPRPKVYFEEWDDPLISGIGWVSELIEIAGGQDILPQLRHRPSARDRIVPAELVRSAAPDVILASWCGKKVVPDRIRRRPGWNEIPAVRNDRIIEIKSPLILQPGPAALTDGLDAIVAALWPAATISPPRTKPQ